MFCNKCGFKNAENLKYCGNQLVIPEQLVIPGAEQIPKGTLDPKRDPFAQNYKKIFNICLYTVIGFIVFFILISFFRSWVFVFSNLMDIFFNFWIWLFLIFIFIFRKKHKVWALVLSIIFGSFTILAASYPYISPRLNN